MLKRDQVVSWLEEVGVTEYLDADLVEEQAEEFAWSLAFRGGAFGTTVAQSSKPGEGVRMQVSVAVSDGHREDLRAFSEQKRQRFEYDLRILVLQQPVGHLFEFEPDTGVLKNCNFGLNLYEDPITKAGFFRRNHQLQSTAQLAVQFIQKATELGDW